MTIALDARTNALKARLQERLDMNAGAERQQQGQLRQTTGVRGGSLYDPGFASREQEITENRQQANMRSHRQYSQAVDDATADDANRQAEWDRQDRLRREDWEREDRLRAEDKGFAGGMWGSTFGINANTGRPVFPQAGGTVQPQRYDPNAGSYASTTSADRPSMGMNFDQSGNVIWNGGGGLVNFGTSANHIGTNRGGGSFINRFIDPMEQARQRKIDADRAKMDQFYRSMGSMLGGTGWF
jgi:hypothetical protein